MPQEFIWGDFGAGWIPSDDAQGGRKNGMLRMDNVELDKNGALSLVGGAKTLQSFVAPAIALYDTIIGGVEVLYSATADKKVYRGNTELTLGAGIGDDSIAAFGSGFQYVIIADGDKRYKDNGSTAVQLGLSQIAQPTVAVVAGNYSNSLTPIDWAYNNGVDSGTTGSPSFSLSAPGVLITLTTSITNNTSLSAVDLSSLANGGDGNAINQSDNDLINISFVANSGNLSGITAVSLKFFSGITGSYFLYTTPVSNPGTTINILISRNQFNSFGPGPDWANVYQFAVYLTTKAAVNFTMGATIIPVVDAALTPPSTHYAFYNGINSNIDGQDAVVRYVPILINSNNNYVGTGAFQDSITSGELIVSVGTDVKISVVASTDPQVNFIWLYRIGGNLGQWYRVKVIPNTTGDYIDNLSDLNALEQNITLNLNLASVNYLFFTDKIYSIIGPIEGRWYYFTNQFMYPSDINNFDVVDISRGVRTCGSDNELFMWAIKVAEGYVLVGTTVDIYVLSGTFTTLPDGVIDIYYRPMVCQHPPIAKDATFANGLVYYLAADGWRSIGTSASTTELLVAPSTDQLYNNVERYGYNPSSSSASNFVPGSARFPVVVTKNKLWCCVDDRIEVWDFVRRYWRSFSYNLGGVGAITKGLNGNPIAGYLNDSIIREIDTTLVFIDLNLQTVSILSPVFDASQSLNRCDLYTLKVRCSTGLGENLACSLILADGTNYFIGNASSYTELEQQIILDINNIIPFPTTTFQIYLTGQFTRFLLSDIRVSYDSRPNQYTAMRIYNTNFGSAGKKRLRMWPIIIDTLGNDVVYKPFVDNIQGVSQVLNSTDKTTVPVFYNFDAFGTDYGVLLTGGPFEFYEMGQPEIVQALPGPKMYDQVGPQELFRYGKIREFEIRLVPYGGDIGTTSELPYTFYFDDFSVHTGTITVNNGQEQTYSLGIPKGVSGTVIRIELGPVTYQFIRYYLRVRAVRHGNDSTDNSSWVTL